jgi:hypothetical protein
MKVRSGLVRLWKRHCEGMSIKATFTGGDICQ